MNNPIKFFDYLYLTVAVRNKINCVDTDVLAVKIKMQQYLEPWNRNNKYI